MKNIKDEIQKHVFKYGDPCLVTKKDSDDTIISKKVKIPTTPTQPWTSSRIIFDISTKPGMLKYKMFYWTRLVKFRINQKLNEQHYG